MKKGLNLGALEETLKAPAIDTAVGETGEEISCDLIVCEKQIRRDDNPGFAPESIANLADDIEANGQIAPAIVRPHPTMPGKFLLVSGERRLRACKIRNRPIKVVKRDLTDEQARHIQRSENVHQEALTRLEIAQSLKEDKENYKTLEAVSGKWHKSVQWVSEHLKYLDALSKGGAATDAVVKGVTSDITAVNELDKLDKLNPSAAAQLVKEIQDKPDSNVRAAVRERLTSEQKKVSKPAANKPAPKEEETAVLLIAISQISAVCESVETIAESVKGRPFIKKAFREAIKSLAQAQAVLNEVNSAAG